MNQLFNLSLNTHFGSLIIMALCALPPKVNTLKPELCTATLHSRHRHIARLFMISQKCVNFPSKLQNRFSNVSCFPLVMQILPGNDAHSLSHIHTHALPESTLKLGLLEVCVWDCAEFGCEVVGTC